MWLVQSSDSEIRYLIGDRPKGKFCAVSPLPNHQTQRPSLFDHGFLFCTTLREAWSRAQLASHAPHSPGCRSPPNDRLTTGIGLPDAPLRCRADAHMHTAMHAHWQVCMWLQQGSSCCQQHGLPRGQAGCTRPPAHRGSWVSCLKAYWSPRARLTA